MEKIYVERGMTTLIAKEIGCSSQSVRFALRGVTESDQADRIREMALRIGGFFKPKKETEEGK